MSAQIVNKPTSFGDDPVFDPHSTPDVEYNIEPAIPAESVPIVETTVISSSATGATGTKIIAPSCNINAPPWPTIIISLLGAVVIIYTAVAPNVDSSRRIFGIILILLWTVIWAIILWVLWHECHRSVAWWLLLIPVIAMALFFILIIILNIGST